MTVKQLGCSAGGWLIHSGWLVRMLWVRLVFGSFFDDSGWRASRIYPLGKWEDLLLFHLPYHNIQPFKILLSRIYLNSNTQNSNPQYNLLDPLVPG